MDMIMFYLNYIDQKILRNVPNSRGYYLLYAYADGHLKKIFQKIFYYTLD